MEKALSNPGPGQYMDQSNSTASKTLFGSESAVFKDKQDRDGYVKDQPGSFKNQRIGPGDYFKNGHPFCKKTYNASLPQPRFF